MDCIFCKIIAGEIPSNKEYEDDTVLAFRDIEPKAPVHILVVPKKHITGAADVQSEDGEVIGHIFRVIAQVADQQGLTDFRVVTNNGAGAGQTVPHLHFHILAGRQLGEMG